MPNSPSSLKKLQCLSEEATRSVFILNAYLEHTGKCSGPAYHKSVAAWLTSGSFHEKELGLWLDEHLAKRSRRLPRTGDGAVRLHQKHFDRARGQADQRLRQGISLLTWQADGFPPAHENHSSCPQVLTCRGSIPRDLEWISLFNSRKPKSIHPQAPWLAALRAMLRGLDGPGTGVISSCGTLTYDLVTLYGNRVSLPLLLILPFAIEDPLTPHEGFNRDGLPIFEMADMVLSCTNRAVQCPKQNLMTCRDRLLAHLSDAHFLVNIRKPGNLWNILHRQQTHAPRRQEIVVSHHHAPQASGNLQLLDAFPHWSEPFKIETLIPSGSKEAAVGPPWNLARPGTSRSSREVEWRDCLYHYTRSCAGPWPGQSYPDYLKDLLEGAPDAGHTALDTLVRIVLEGTIRAGNKLVRGLEAVVSFSARPPHELAALRRWNKALIRWTFEPFGIALPRRNLVKIGAKPAIYAPSVTFDKLAPKDRFRFQRHEMPNCAWKHEREWRLSGDLKLTQDCGAFVFVPRASDAETLQKTGHCPFPIVVLEDPGSS